MIKKIKRLSTSRIVVTLFVLLFAVLGYLFLKPSRAANADVNGDGTVNILDLSIIASNWGQAGKTFAQGDLTGDGTVNVLDLSVLATNWGSGGGLACTNPVYTDTWPQKQYAGWDGPGGSVQNDVQSNGAGPKTDSQQLNVCSLTNWNVVANWGDRGGSIEAYPDTNFNLVDKTVSSYASMQTCFGNIDPIPSGPQWPTAGGSEWDYAYDVWINNHTGESTWSNDIEIMVWNDYTDTSIYPPPGSRAITIDGVAYHMFRGGGANEWIYTRDTKATSGCFDMLNIIKDITNHQTTTTIFTDTNQQVPLSQSGLTNNGAPQHVEYGVEISGTYGTQTFQITNATLTAN